MTLGDRYPRLAVLMGYEEIAATVIEEDFQADPDNPANFDDPEDPGGGGTMMARAPSSTSSGVDPAVRDAVNACPARGPEGGLKLTEAEGAGSCCGGPERTACSLGRGARPGRVTLRECLACKNAELYE